MGWQEPGGWSYRRVECERLLGRGNAFGARRRSRENRVVEFAGGKSIILDRVRSFIFAGRTSFIECDDRRLR